MTKEEDEKYSAVANFCWLISIMIGVGVGFIKGNVGWAIVALAVTMVVLCTGFTTAIWLSREK